VKEDDMTMTRPRLRVAVLVIVAAVTAAAPAITQEGIEVTEHGVGTGVENRALVGEATSFPEGSIVVFWTRVTGGADGDRIEHVWTGPDGKEVRIGLALGGPHWRTHSQKTLHPGSAGAWTVRAVDADGNSLAEAAFECVAAGE